MKRRWISLFMIFIFLLSSCSLHVSTRAFHKDEIDYASFYIQRTNEKGGIVDTRIIKSEDPLQETMLVLKVTFYTRPLWQYDNYYMRSVDEALDWIVKEGDKEEIYTVPEGILPYPKHISFFYKNGQWMAETVGNSNKLTMDQIKKHVPFPEEKKKKENKSGCTLDEFIEMYGSELELEDDDEFGSYYDAKEWYDDWGCEPPY